MMYYGLKKEINQDGCSENTAISDTPARLGAWCRKPFDSGKPNGRDQGTAQQRSKDNRPNEKSAHCPVVAALLVCAETVKLLLERGAD
jgi:hypothetical protein